MAEVEFSVPARDLPGQVADSPVPERHAAAGRRQRNLAQVKVNRRFTTADARTKLGKLHSTADG